MLIPNSTLQNGRYQIIAHLGGGGQGNVYVAQDMRLNNRVAIKEALGNDPATKEAFKKEAQRLDRLRHSALPTVKDHFSEGQGQYLVMEFIAGQDLAQMLNARGQPFPVEEVLAWGKQLLNALAYLHQRGVIHRDIKPANLKLTPEREIVLLDFGLAKGGLSYSINSLKGYTPGFAPPEQMTGQVTDERSDLYSLGATLYALLTAAIPVDPLSRLYTQSQGNPDPLRPANELNPQVPPHIAQMLTRAMALEPNQRPASAKEMLALLSPPTAPPPTSANSFPRSLKSQPTWLLWTLGSVAAVLLVVIMAGFTMMMSLPTELVVAPTPPLPTLEPSPTPPASTLEPSPTPSPPTLEPSSTPSFPLLAGTPLPQSLAVISDENASELREIARLRKGSLSEIAYSPDGELLAMGTSDGIYLYDAETLLVVRLLDSQESINTIAFSPNGRWLAAGSRENSIQLWQVPDGQLLRTLKGHTDDVNSVTFSPDSERLASGGCSERNDKNSCLAGEVRLWRVSDGQLLRTLQGHTNEVRSVSFSLDGKRLASGSCGERNDNRSCVAGEVRLWRVSDGERLTTLSGHTSFVNSVSFSPDSELLASGSDDKTIRLWRVSDGQLLRTLQAHTDDVRSISFSPDSEHLASGSDDDTVRLWRVSDGELLSTLSGHTSSVSSVSFSPNGERLASGSWNATVLQWRVSDGELLTTLKGHRSDAKSVSFSPDSEHLASGLSDDTVQLWRVSDGQLLRTLQGHTNSVYSVDFSPDGERLASGSRDGTVRLWRVSDGELLRTLQGHTNEVWSVSFSPDSERLASGSCSQEEDNSCAAGEVRLWQVSDGQLLATLKGHTDRVRSVSFSPDGKLLASGSGDETVRLWRVSDGQLLATLSGHRGAVWSVSFSPDGDTLASGSHDGTVRLWRVSDGQLLRTLEEHTSGVESVSFSPDSGWLASGSWDGTVWLWRASDGQLLRTLEGHTFLVHSLSLSADGRLLASSSNDGTIRLWGVVP